MDVARRLKFGLAALGALLVSAFTAVPALADTPPDPSETNIPYLAWRGEQVRLVKCHPVISPTGAGQRADLILVDWSGEEHALAIPHFETGTGGFFAATGPDHRGQGCVAGSFSSQKAGLAQIKLVVSSAPGGGQVGSSITGAVGTPILKHDFLIGYMNLNTPVLSASNAGSVGDGPITTDPASLVDNVGAGRNNFRVDVTGNIPLRANFRELGLGDTLTMPNDWARLAGVMATYFNPDNPNAAFMWDIHDDRSTDLVHGLNTQSPCRVALINVAATTDAVDNCTQFLTAFAALGTGEFGSFSNKFSRPTDPTIGPFDPLVPRQTLMPNGRLDAGDAPMPAARIDFRTSGGGFFGCIGLNPPANATGAAGSLTNCTAPGGLTAGQTSAACTLAAFQGANCAAKDKHVIYSRDGTGTNSSTVADFHNLYAPFYGRYIPATARPIAEASGSEGPAGSVLNTATAPAPGTNNFNGWLVNGLYHYWDVARVLNQGVGGNTNCLLRFNTTFTGGVLNRTPVFRQNISGPQTVAVYTDEHGEAHVWWYPGTGLDFGALGVAGNLNLGCELQGVNPLARPTIQATARYPYQPVTDAPKVSNALGKTISNLFNKRLSCAPKGTNPNDQFSQVCLVEARDITGSAGPFVGEIVCFATNAELIQYFSTFGTQTLPVALGGGGVQVAGTLLTPAEMALLGKAGAAVQCQRLDAGGRAAVEVFGKGPSNVIADFVDEGLIRVVTFNFASGTGATGTTESAGAPTPAAAATAVAAVNNSTGTQAVQSNGSVVTNNGGTPEVKAPTTKAPAVQARVSRAELVRPVRGSAYLLLKVSSTQPTAKVAIKLMGSRTTVSTLERVVKTNKLVKVQIKLAKSVASIRVSIAG